jgi:hypothetical protein
MICNLLVIVTWCYRTLQHGRDMDDELGEYLSTQSPVPLTDVVFTDISSESHPNTTFSSRRGTSIFRSNDSANNTSANDQTHSSTASRSSKESPPHQDTHSVASGGRIHQPQP